MPQHPAVYEALARDRAAELQRTMQVSARNRRCPRGSRLAGRARQNAGWFLVDVGLRLASSRGVTRPA